MCTCSDLISSLHRQGKARDRRKTRGLSVVIAIAKISPPPKAVNTQQSKAANTTPKSTCPSHLSTPASETSRKVSTVEADYPYPTGPTTTEQQWQAQKSTKLPPAIPTSILIDWTQHYRTAVAGQKPHTVNPHPFNLHPYLLHPWDGNEEEENGEYAKRGGEEEGRRLKPYSSSGIYVTASVEAQCRLIAQNWKMKEEEKIKNTKVNALKRAACINQRATSFVKLFSNLSNDMMASEEKSTPPPPSPHFRPKDGVDKDGG